MNQGSNHPEISKRRFDAHGSMTVEAALVLPILLIVFIAVIDFGRVFYWSLALSNAARVGAEYGAIDRIKAYQENAMVNQAQTAAEDDIGTTNVSCIACPPDSTSDGCKKSDGSTINPCLCGAISPMQSCNDTCASNVHLYVQVQCQATFRTVSSYLGFSSITLIRSARIAVQ
jgi:Flp pilus assembly protein TadG